MKTTVYEIENGQRSWMWDSMGETADLGPLGKGIWNAR